MPKLTGVLKALSGTKKSPSKHQQVVTDIVVNRHWGSMLSGSSKKVFYFWEIDPTIPQETISYLVDFLREQGISRVHIKENAPFRSGDKDIVRFPSSQTNAFETLRENLQKNTDNTG